MRLNLVIEKKLSSKEIAKIIKEAIQPDNKEAPTNTEIKLELFEYSLIIKIDSTADIPSFLRTIDDLLACINAAERALNEFSS
ncbi:MAG: KEOPS complex subunit Pcc1 [Candidatus Methanomethylicaceae archaeon]|nr:KEOPS complex subunit Pcc1 [Candidatus Verstraetearchaeota archaeon]